MMRIVALYRLVFILTLFVLVGCTEASAQRTALTTDGDWYVRTDGNDNCNGLTDAAGSSGDCAFRTIPYALKHVVGQVDGAGHECRIHVGAGTYTEYSEVYLEPIGCVPELIGDVTTPSNVVVSVTSPPAAAFDLRRGMKLKISGFKVQTINFGWCFHISNLSQLMIVGNMDFAGCASGDMTSAHNSVISSNGANYTISGSSPVHWNIANGGIIQEVNGSITLTGTPSFSAAFARGFRGGTLQTNFTFSGSATGKRYDLSCGAQASSPNELPGNVAGTVSTYAIYN